MKKGFTGLEVVIIVVVVSILVFLAIPKVSDVKNSSRAAKVQRELVSLRVAIDEYYTKTETFPKLIGNEEKLKEISDKNINFGELLNKKTMYSTPSVKGIQGSNLVQDREEFEIVDDIGGWNYNYAGRTGEIHANIPKNSFNQDIDWSLE